MGEKWVSKTRSPTARVRGRPRRPGTGAWPAPAPASRGTSRRSSGPLPPPAVSPVPQPLTLGEGEDPVLVDGEHHDGSTGHHGAQPVLHPAQLVAGPQVLGEIGEGHDRRRGVGLPLHRGNHHPQGAGMPDAFGVGELNPDLMVGLAPPEGVDLGDQRLVIPGPQGAGGRRLGETLRAGRPEEGLGGLVHPAHRHPRYRQVRLLGPGGKEGAQLGRSLGVPALEQRHHLGQIHLPQRDGRHLEEVAEVGFALAKPGLGPHPVGEVGYVEEEVAGPGGRVVDQRHPHQAPSGPPLLRPQPHLLLDAPRLSRHQELDGGGVLDGVVGVEAGRPGSAHQASSGARPSRSQSAWFTWTRLPSRSRTAMPLEAPWKAACSTPSASRRRPSVRSCSRRQRRVSTPSRQAAAPTAKTTRLRIEAAGVARGVSANKTAPK